MTGGQTNTFNFFFILQDFMFWFFFGRFFVEFWIIKRNYDFAGLLNSWTWQSKFFLKILQTHSHTCDKYWISIPLQIDLENVLFAIFGTVVVILFILTFNLCCLWNNKNYIYFFLHSCRDHNVLSSIERSSFKLFLNVQKITLNAVLIAIMSLT